MKKVRHGVNLMIGYKSTHSKLFANKIQIVTPEYVNDIDKFYNRLNRHGHSKYVDHEKAIHLEVIHTLFALTNRNAWNLKY